MTTKSKVLTFAAAIARLEETIVASHIVITKTRAKIAEDFKASINIAINVGQQNKMVIGDIRDAIVSLFDRHVMEGHIEKATARAYMTGLRFALDRGVLWNPSLHTAEGQIQSLNDAKKDLPPALAKKAEELAKQDAAKRDARQPVGDSVDTALAKTVKLLATWRTLGKNDVAACLLDAIHMLNPSFTEEKNK